MRVLVADVLPQEGLEQITALGHDVVYEPDVGADVLIEHIKGVNVLVVRSTEVTAEVVDASDVLSLVIRAGSGVNTIDLTACARKGIFVSNCPGLNSVAVAELTMAHILSLDRNIPDCVADLRAGKWDKAKYAKIAYGLKGRFLGIIGFGNIGREVTKRAMAFDMKVVVYDPMISRSAIEMTGASYCDALDKLLRKSDIVTIHVPLTESTRNMMDAKAFEAQRSELRDKLSLLENQLLGPLFNGTEFSLADAAFAPFFMRLQLLEQWHTMGLMEGLPKIGKWAELLLARPAVQASVVSDFSDLYRAHIVKAGKHGASVFAA